MSESVLNHMNKILTRVDQKIFASASRLGTFESFKATPAEFEKPEGGKTVDSIQEIIKNSIGKYLKLEKPKTPEIKEEYKERAVTPKVPRPQEAKFQPKLNKNSLKIASRLKESKERTANSSTPKLIPRDDEFTYQPQINKYSQKIVSKKPEVKTRWDALYEQGKDKKKEMEKARKENENREKETLNCSFRPNILQPSLNTNPNKTVERLNSWAKSRDSKIKDRKENEAEKGLKDCTFMPKIIENLVSCKSLNEIKGVTPYVERGKKIQNSESEKPVIKSVNRDIGKKLYNELVEALHEALY